MKDTKIDTSQKGPLRARDKRPSPAGTSAWMPTMINPTQSKGSVVPDDRGKHTQYDPGKRSEQRGKIVAEGDRVINKIGGEALYQEFGNPIKDKDPEGIEIGCEGPEWL
jgi:hypothetical protein